MTTILFEHNYSFDGLKIRDIGSNMKVFCVFPVYATTSRFKVFSSKSKESITQISNYESQPRAIRVEVGVGASNNENEEDKEQLPATKRMRISPE